MVQIGAGEGETAGNPAVDSGIEAHLFGFIFGDSVFGYGAAGEIFRDKFQIGRLRSIHRAGTDEQHSSGMTVFREIQHPARPAEDDVPFHAPRHGSGGCGGMENIIKRLIRESEIADIAGDKFYHRQSVEFGIIRQKLFRIAGKDGEIQLRTETAFEHGKDAFPEKSGPSG